jgi:carbon-monoxide dehydrogenase medium subunit
VGEATSEELFKRAAAAATEACRPVTDQRGSAEYKRHVAGVLTERALLRAATRALPGKTPRRRRKTQEV